MASRLRHIRRSEVQQLKAASMLYDRGRLQCDLIEFVTNTEEYTV